MGLQKSDKIRRRLTLFSGKDHTFLFELSTFCTEFLKELRMCIVKGALPGWQDGIHQQRSHGANLNPGTDLTKETFTEQLSVRFLVSSDNSVVPPANQS